MLIIVSFDCNIYFMDEHFQDDRLLQVLKQKCKKTAQSLMLTMFHRFLGITFTFKLSVQNLVSGHYQGNPTPPRTDPSHRKLGPLAQKQKILLHFTSNLSRAPTAGFPEKWEYLHPGKYLRITSPPPMLHHLNTDVTHIAFLLFIRTGPLKLEI